MTQQMDTREPEHLRRIKAQIAAWDEADVDKRLARLAAWHAKVAQLPPEGGRVQGIPTHNRPHADEVMMFFLGAQYPSALFGDIRHIINLQQIEDLDRPFGAGIIFNTKSGIYQGTDWIVHWRNGLRPMGTGGSVLDEHPIGDKPETEKESGATLMARLLGQVNREELQRILSAIRKNDTEGTQSALIDELLKTKKDYQVTDWLGKPLGGPEDQAHQLVVIRKKLIWIKQFVEHEILTIQEFKQRGYIRDIDGQRDILIGRISSHLPTMMGYMSEKYGTTMNIQVNAGHAIILPDKKKIPMEVIHEIAAAIRTEEARIQGRPLPTNQSLLSRKGTLECAPEWFYTFGFLINGGDTSPGVEATHIAPERLEGIVAEVLAAKASRIREWRKAQKDAKSQMYRQQGQRV